MPDVHANLSVILDVVFKWLGLLIRIQDILGSNPECGLRFDLVHLACMEQYLKLDYDCSLTHPLHYFIC